MLYNVNKYFSKFKNCQIFNHLAKMNKIKSTKLLENLKKENNLKYRDQIITKNALDKYWKEPMAWH